MKQLIIFLSFSFLSTQLTAQFITKKFGSGIQITSQDSSIYMHIGLRFQNRYSSEWTVRNDDFNYIENYQSSFFIRRARLKFDGYAFSPKLNYEVELGLSNTDLNGGNNKEHGFAPRMILDAYVDWNFYKNFSLRVGQSKLPGNRERLVSSATMQFVDRSQLNSYYTLDRDMGLQLMHHFKLGKNFEVNEKFAFTQGEGRDVTSGNLGGFDYTFRLEILPFGQFAKNGAYIGGAIVREQKPKLALAVTYDINDKAVRTNGQLGNFLFDLAGNYAGKTLNTLFIDFMFKYKNLSIMGEYANKSTADGDPRIYDQDGTTLIGTMYTGSGLNLQAGWIFTSNWEIAARYTMVNPDNFVGVNETEYTLGLSKYIVEHKLKFQMDVSYRQLDFIGNTSLGNGRNDKLIWRMQMDIHF